MKHALFPLVKLTAAAATILVVASLMLVLSPEKPAEGVQEAQADIFDIVSSSALKETIFSDIMQDAGMHPRPFDYNGNVVLFGSMSVAESPEHAMSAFQQKFVQEGINKKTHTKTMAEYGVGAPSDDGRDEEFLAAARGEPHQFRYDPQDEISAEIANDFLNGEILPVVRQEGFVSMAGIIPMHQGSRPLEVGEASTRWHTNAQGVPDPRENTKGFRYMDFATSVDTKTTSVTGVWADKNFDAKKLDPKYEGVDHSIDQHVPACIGCSRTFRIDGLNKESDPFTTNQYYSSSSDSAQIGAFYEAALGRTGWTPAPAQRYMDRLFEELPSLSDTYDGRMLFLEREGERLEVMLQPTDHGTMVTTMHEQRTLDGGTP